MSLQIIAEAILRVVIGTLLQTWAGFPLKTFGQLRAIVRLKSTKNVAKRSPIPKP
jgi:hypothetical protein